MSGPAPSIQYSFDGPGTLGSGDNAKFLRWNNATGRFEMASGGGSVALDDLTDVTITSPAAGNTFYYNGSAWVNGAILSLSATSPNALIVAQGAAHIPLVVRAAGSQSANLVTYQSSAPATLGGIGPAGEVIASANSSAASCDIQFQGDPDTGWIRVGADAIRSYAGGVQVSSFTAGRFDFAAGTQVYVGNAGVAATPSLAGTNAGGSGLWWPSSSSIAISGGASGVERLRADGNGVSFNGATPAAQPDYTVTNPSTSRSLDVSAATLADVRAFLGTLASDLIAYGLFQ